MSDDAKILVVDDVPVNVRLLEAVLVRRATRWSPRTTARRLELVASANRISSCSTS